MMRHYRIRIACGAALLIIIRNPIMNKAIDPAALRLTQFSHGGG
jgi:hypothetical protein